jgi:hypothetical protein
MKTTYIVSGYMRSGTSMMMQALSVGGLEPESHKSREHMNQQFGDKEYKPNDGGFYELSRQQYQAIGFPKAHEGKLIKCLYGGVHRIAAGDYKIVYMLRDYEEIRQSYEAFFDVLPNLQTEEQYNEVMNITIGILEQRKDVNLTVLNYRDVVENPVSAFIKLKNRGWNIDPYKAAKVVDPELCRFRKELLEVGI